MDRPSPLVLRVFPRVVVGIVAIVSLLPALLTIAGDDESARTLGGDFPSFYAAGEIVLDGRIDELYDPAVQAAYQGDFQERDEGLLYFAYPPVTAVLYAPFALLPYGVAASIHALIAMVALIGAMWFLLPQVDAALSRRDHVAIGVAAGLAMMPVVVAVLGGQNTTFTLLIIAGTWYLASGDRSVAAGVVAGALVFKPQFGLLLVAAIAIARLWRAVVGAAAVWLVAYAIGAGAMGATWPSAWLDQVRTFGDLNADANGELFVNVTGFVGQVVVNDGAALVVGGALWLLIAVTTVIVLVRHGLTWGSVGITASGIMLLSPSTLFYDAGVGIVAGLVAGIGTAGIFPIVVLTGAATWLQALENSLGWSPLFVVLAAIWTWQVVLVLGSGVVSQAPGTLAAPAGQEQRSSGWRAIRSS